jgi:hypothetical protein
LTYCLLQWSRKVPQSIFDWSSVSIWISCYEKLYPNVRLIPKQHFMVHYPNQIVRSTLELSLDLWVFGLVNDGASPNRKLFNLHSTWRWMWCCI